MNHTHDGHLPEVLRLLSHRLSQNPVPDPAECQRPSAVLVTLNVHAGKTQVLLIRRPDFLSEHPGQVACPGGSWEHSDASWWETAIREAREEVGIVPTAVMRLGPLPPVYIPRSRFTLVPYVGYVPRRPVLDPAPNEVAEALWVPLEELREARHTVTRERGGLLRPWPEFALPTATVWGATAIFLDQLLKMFSEEESRQLALDVSPRFQA